MADSKLTALSEISVPALEDLLYWVDDPSGTPASDKASAKRGLAIAGHVCQGRLTLESGVPVSTSDQTGKTSVYFTPYNGGNVRVYDGTRWVLYAFTELTLALGTLTSGANYDVFLYDNSGTLTLKLGPAWSSDTARGTGAGTTELVLQDGVWVNAVSIASGPGAKAGLYLGTLRTTSTTATEDSGGGATTNVGGRRFVWNAYNRVPRTLAVIDTTDSWSYNSSTIRQARGQSGNKVEYVCGLALDVVSATVLSRIYIDAAGEYGSSGVGVDSTTAYSGRFGTIYGASNTFAATTTADYRGIPGLGYHYIAWLEAALSGTVDFAGDDGGTSSCGLNATVMA